MEYVYSCIRWCEDMLHTGSFREHGPCEIRESGIVYFSQIDSAAYNRSCGPAIIYPDGTMRYNNSHGQLHRTDGAALIYNRSKEYWIDGHHLSSEEFFLKYGVL